MNNKSETFRITSELIHGIFNLGLKLFEDDSDVEKFCIENRAINGQSWLAKDALKLILEKSHRDKVNHFEDLLRVRITLFYFEGKPIVVGPYLTEEITIGQCIQICNEVDKKGMDAKDLIIYYGKYPVIPESRMEKIIHSILHTLEIEGLSEHFTKYKGNTKELFNDNELGRISNANIEAHYVTEREYMDAIKSGNIHKTLHYKQLLTENAAGMWTRKSTLQEKRFGLAVNRAMSRIAAYEAGVPAPIIHKITTKESLAIAIAQSEKQMDEACETMLKEFCEIIRIIRDKKYSALTQSIIYYINQQYMNDISISGIAKELNITESYMISQFRKETNKTPAQYLRQIRLKEAAHLLISTNDEIQKISGSVGIPDANYFVKLFKAEFEMTPGAYRKCYKI